MVIIYLNSQPIMDDPLVALLEKNQYTVQVVNSLTLMMEHLGRLNGPEYVDLSMIKGGYNGVKYGEERYAPSYAMLTIAGSLGFGYLLDKPNIILNREATTDEIEIEGMRRASITEIVYNPENYDGVKENVLTHIKNFSPEQAYQQ